MCWHPMLSLQTLPEGGSAAFLLSTMSSAAWWGPGHWLLQRSTGTREFDSQTLKVPELFCFLQHNVFTGVCMSELWRWILMWNSPV